MILDVIGVFMISNSGFMHPEYLVDAEWVDLHKDDPNVIVVDSDVPECYRRGHIPGSVMVPDNWEKDPETGRIHVMNPQQFAAMCESLGIGDNTEVVTYDGSQSLYAARLWWSLTYYGHQRVKVLDGGWRRWVSEGRVISFDRTDKSSSVTFTPKIDDTVIARVNELKTACDNQDSIIWDVRSSGEYDGSDIGGNERAGHLPGAVNLEWFNVVDRNSHQFKDPKEIRKILEDRGITPDKPIYSY